MLARTKQEYGQTGPFLSYLTAVKLSVQHDYRMVAD
jgi:hypothetical protein